jgi:uncharacterized protein
MVEEEGSTMSELSGAVTKQRVIEEILRERSEGICFVVCGSAGVGKTSTINVLFNVDMHTEVAKPGTTAIHEVTLLVKNVRQHKLTGVQDVPLTVYDLPGLGDGYHKTSETYFDWYRQILPRADVILWVVRADQRAYEYDVEQISQLVNELPDIKSKVILGLNVIDKVEPNDWDTRINQPSPVQEGHFAEITAEAQRLIHDQCGLTSKSISLYSAKQAYGLELLFSRLIAACPKGKRWVFADLKQDYRDAFLAKVSPKYRETVAAQYSR